MKLFMEKNVQQISKVIHENGNEMLNVLLV